MDLQKQASKYYWYHSVDLENGVILDGDYDIREVLLHYGFPERMDGMDVLDVGRGSGFFAFEFERRRAAVTATDVCSFLEWDFVGGDEQREARRKAIGKRATVYRLAHHRGVRVCQRGEEVACHK